MALTSIDEVLTGLQVRLTGDASLDGPTTVRYDMLRQVVEAAVKQYVKWPIEAPADDVTTYLDGKGYMDVYLRPWTTAVTAVYLDQGGYAGQGVTPFPASTLQTAGRDYYVVLDDERRGALIAQGGILRRIASPNVWAFPSDMVWYRGQGGLAWRRGPYWPAGMGNIKVVYTYGFAPGNIPQDIKLAVVTAVGIARNSILRGGPLSSENLGDYSYNVNINLKDRDFVGVQSLLASYRDTPFGSNLS